MFASWEIITHINQTLRAHVHLECVSKETNTWDEMIAHFNPAMHVKQNSTIKLKYFLFVFHFQRRSDEPAAAATDSCPNEEKMQNCDIKTFRKLWMTFTTELN